MIETINNILEQIQIAEVRKTKTILSGDYILFADLEKFIQKRIERINYIVRNN